MLSAVGASNACPVEVASTPVNVADHRKQPVEPFLVLSAKGSAATPVMQAATIHPEQLCQPIPGQSAQAAQLMDSRPGRLPGT